MARRAGAGRRLPAQSDEREGVGLLVLRHLRQPVLRLARLATFGSHRDIMPNPGRAAAPSSGRTSGAARPSDRTSQLVPGRCAWQAGRPGVGATLEGPIRRTAPARRQTCECHYRILGPRHDVRTRRAGNWHTEEYGVRGSNRRRPHPVCREGAHARWQRAEPLSLRSITVRVCQDEPDAGHDRMA